MLDLEAMLAVRDISLRSKARRRFLARSLDRPIEMTLEIGALNVPTILPGECDARFLDWFSTDSLRARHADNPVVPPESIVDIDYVISDSNLASHIPDTFDLVIANHVFEHIPDPINWLRQIADITNPGGSLLLAIPDRRFTFDYYRPESDAVDIVRAHEDRLQRPSVDQIARHLYYFTAVDHTGVWAGENPPDFEPRMTFGEALEKARELEPSYTDVHCWVFTRSTFDRTFNALSEAGLIPWRVAASEDVQTGENEFRVLLTHTPSLVAADA